MGFPYHGAKDASSTSQHILIMLTFSSFKVSMISILIDSLDWKLTNKADEGFSMEMDEPSETQLIKSSIGSFIRRFKADSMTVSTCTHALSKIYLTRFDISIVRDLLAAFSPRVRPTLRSSSSLAAATTAVAAAQEYYIRPAFSHILHFLLHFY
ncbi:hypothetical protein Q3G72_011725 [Acer saccharum]|nr:hypothetical protein Q3G72_011725 [Acer saccharum]